MASNRAAESKQTDKRIFLSWGGDEALQIARWLKEQIFDPTPGLRAFLSEQIEPGKESIDTIHDELDHASGAIGIMTNIALDRPWFLYEIAYLRARKLRPPLLRFCSELPDGHPLKVVQYADGFEFASLNTLLTEFLKGEDKRLLDLVLRNLALKAEDWNAITKPLRTKNTDETGILKATVSAIDTIQKYKRWGEASKHPCMQALACKTLNDLVVSFRGLMDRKQRSYKIDYRRYPEYLISLQSSLDTKTIAIAIVDGIEEFWAHKTGDTILESTSASSQRIFIFENPELFRQYFEHILRHAEKYAVFVMSAKDFGRVRHRVTHDFSVIQDLRTKDRMTAFYDNAAASIEFSTDEQIIEQKIAVFKDVLRWAHRIVPEPLSDSKRYEKELCERIFTANAEEAGQHSSVIPLELYDAFEEDHPFYREMREQMLAEFRAHADEKDSDLRVLEIGAGTGLFTKRLAQQPYTGLTIKAMEPDVKAHPLLLRKVQCKPNTVQPIMASILTYDPRGEFRFVFSSFSEHHIRPEDKAQYFRVIFETMEPGGYLIIGDEFLSPYESNNEAAYEHALEVYHNYIIKLATTSHLFEVAELERLAMESGRPSARDRIDFKVTVDWYERKASEAGLLLQAKHCITPPELKNEIGGIYVLVFQKPASASLGFRTP